MGRGLAVASLAIAGFAVSWASILILLSGLNPIAVAFWRTMIAAALLMPIGLRGLGGARGRLLPVLAGGVALAMHFITWITSLRLTTVAISVTLVTTYPIFTIPMELAVGRRLSTLTIAGALTAVLGSAAMAMVSYGIGPMGLTGALLALAGAASGAVYFFSGSIARSYLSTATYSSLAYLVAAAVSALAALAMGDSLAITSAWSLSMILLLVLGPMLAGHTLMNYALRYLPATTVSTATLVEPVGSTVIAYLILHQPVTAPEAAAMAITLSGVYLAVRGGLAGA